MTTNLGSITAAPSAPFQSLIAAIRSQSPPTLPNAQEVNCDPVDIVNVVKTLPVLTHVTTAEGHAHVSTSDKHA